MLSRIGHPVLPISSLVFLFIIFTPLTLAESSAQVTVLTQADFANGTYRITEPGTYVLGEDIVMHPNPENNFRPYNLFPGQPQYESHPPQPFGFYSFGFFAGITIETCDVILDFKGHSFEQSKEFLFNQRFFETVLLSDDPFLPFAGTEPFNQLNSACNTTVKNGRINQTSHNGIGGLGASNITIKDMDIRNFTVAGISIGGGNYIKIKNVKIRDTLNVGDFAEGFRVTSALFARLFLTLQCQTLGPDYTIPIADQTEPVAICDLLNELNHQIDLVKRFTVFNDQSVINDPSWPEAESTYIKPVTQRPNGAVYGIFMQAIEGRAFNQFPDDQPIGASHVVIDNVVLKNIKNEPVELIGLRETNAGILKNPGTDIIRIREISSDFNPDLDAGANYYRGRSLENAILAVMLTESFPGSAGGAVFTEEILAWMTTKPAITLSEALGGKVDDYSLVCNGDGNGHTHKGLLGIRIDSTEEVVIKNVRIKNLENKGSIGNTICGSYEGDNKLGYLGGDTRGVGLFSSTDVKIKHIEIENIETTTRVIGIDLKNAQNVKIKKVGLKDLISTSNTSPGLLPNLKPHACGITGDMNSQVTIGERVRSDNLNALDTCPDELSLVHW